MGSSEWDTHRPREQNEETRNSPHRSYALICALFLINTTTVLHDLRLVEPTNAELCIWRANLKLYVDLQLLRSRHPELPAMFKGQLQFQLIFDEGTKVIQGRKNFQNLVLISEIIIVGGEKKSSLPLNITSVQALAQS